MDLSGWQRGFQRGDRVKHTQGDTGYVVSADGAYALVQWDGMSTARPCSIANLTHDTAVII
jgi:hypothetical protein